MMVASIYIIVIGVLSAMQVLASESVNETPLTQRLAFAQLEFSMDLYRIIAQVLSDNSTAGPNMLLSPYSVSSVLSMLYLGSAGETSHQLQKVLHLNNLTFVEAHRTYRKLVTLITHGKLTDGLTIANQIFVQRGTNISIVYAAALREFYGTTLQAVDFAENATFAQDLINAWIQFQTRGKIDSLLDLPPSRDTKLFIANVLYFKSSWQFQFDKLQTFWRGTFHVSPSESVTTAMMAGRIKVPHGHSSAHECTILELPYEGRRLSMFIVLPDEGNTLMDLEGHLSPSTIHQLFATLREDMVNVRLPRFRLESRIRLKEALASIGLYDVFVPGVADLSGMTNGLSDVFVSDIAHRTVIEVTEDGSEAAAATAVDVERVGSVGEVYFEADRPFVFFIWDYHTNVILFVGRVINPTEM